MEDYHEKKVFWRFGHSSVAARKPLNYPVQTHKFHCGPGLENRHPPNSLVWTKADFTLNVIPEVRGEKAIVLEFMRIHPDHAHVVHKLAINHTNRFKMIFTSKRVIKSVSDIRKMLRFLNIPINIPNPDPFKETSFKSSKAPAASPGHLQREAEEVREKGSRGPESPRVRPQQDRLSASRGASSPHLSCPKHQAVPPRRAHPVQQKGRDPGRAAGPWSRLGACPQGYLQRRPQGGRDKNHLLGGNRAGG